MNFEQGKTWCVRETAAIERFLGFRAKYPRRTKISPLILSPPAIAKAASGDESMLRGFLSGNFRS